MMCRTVTVREGLQDGRGVRRLGMLMDAREERGVLIAATSRLNRMSDGAWLVTSKT
jgi:hypothetical protein